MNILLLLLNRPWFSKDRFETVSALLIAYLGLLLAITIVVTCGIQFSASGRVPVQTNLLAYPVAPEDKTQPVRLLDDAPATYFVAQTGLVSPTSPAPDHRSPSPRSRTTRWVAT